MKKLLCTLLVLSMVFSLFACGNNTNNSQQSPDSDSSTTDEPIYFAWAGPVTGDMKQYGDIAQTTIDIAVDEINASGGILGRELIVDIYDDKNDATEAMNVANQIIDADKYTAVLGHFSSTCSMAVAPLYNDAKMIEYGVTVSHEDFTRDRPYVFRGLLTQSNEARQYADYLYDTLGYRSCGVLYINDDWGKNVSDNFVERFEELGGTITVCEGYIPGQTKDFSPMISKIKETNPDCFYPIAMYADTAQILMQADALDFDVPKIAATSSMVQELLDVAGDVAEGVVFLNIFPVGYEGEEFNRVMDEYKERAGIDANFHVMAYYNAVMQLKQAIELAGSTDIDAVRDQLATAPFESLTGTIEMSEDGDCLYATAPATVKDGVYVRMEG